MAELKNKEDILNEVIEKAINDRAPYETHWQMLAEHMDPTKAYFTSDTTTPNTIDQSLIFDSSPQYYINVLASGLHTMLSSQATKWFFLNALTTNPYDTISHQDQIILDTNRDIIQQYITLSNFETQVFECYSDLVLFGNAVLYIDKDEIEVLRYKHVYLGNIYFRCDKYDRITSIFWKKEMPVWLAVDQFGLENLSSAVQEEWKLNRDIEKNILIYNCIFPSDDEVLGVFGKDMPYVSIYYEKDESHIIQQKGYSSFPFGIARWNVPSNTVYGTGPASIALPDVKSLYRVKRVFLESAEKTVNPAILVPSNMIREGIKNGPGDINYYNAGQGDIRRVIDIPGLPISDVLIQDFRTQLGKIFFQDELQLIKHKNMTATEIIERTQDQMKILAPILGRLQTEFLSSALRRSKDILEQAGKLQPLTASLREKIVTIDFSSPVARVQKEEEVVAVTRTLETMLPLLQFKPELANMFKIYEIGKNVAKIKGLPSKYILSESQLNTLLQQLNAQAQLAQIPSVNKELAQGEKLSAQAQQISQR